MPIISILVSLFLGTAFIVNFFTFLSTVILYSNTSLSKSILDSFMVSFFNLLSTLLLDFFTFKVYVLVLPSEAVTIISTMLSTSF